MRHDDAGGELPNEGVLTFWMLAIDLAEATMALLGPKLEALGFDARLPQCRNRSQAACRALSLAASASSSGHPTGGRNWIARQGVADGSRWHLVRELVDETGERSGGKGSNRYDVVMEALVPPSAEGIPDELVLAWTASADSEDRKAFDTVRIAESYAALRRTVSAQSMSSFLVRRAEECGGVSLRPSGGLYWIPPSHEARWSSLAKAVEASYEAAGARSKVFVLAPGMDPSYAAAVALRAEERMHGELDALSEKLASPKPLGTRATRAVNSRLDRILEDAEECERVLGKAMASVTERVQKARGARAMGAVEELAFG